MLEVCSIWPTCGQSWPSLVERLAQIGKHWLALVDFGRCWPTSAGFGRVWTKSRLPDHLFENTWAFFGQTPGLAGFAGAPLRDVWRATFSAICWSLQSPLQNRPIQGNRHRNLNKGRNTWARNPEEGPPAAIGLLESSYFDENGCNRHHLTPRSPGGTGLRPTASLARQDPTEVWATLPFGPRARVSDPPSIDPHQTLAQASPELAL